MLSWFLHLDALYLAKLDGLLTVFRGYILTIVHQYLALTP